VRSYAAKTKKWEWKCSNSAIRVRPNPHGVGYQLTAKLSGCWINWQDKDGLPVEAPLSPFLKGVRENLKRKFNAPPIPTLH
jgi:hypothetical protein